MLGPRVPLLRAAGKGGRRAGWGGESRDRRSRFAATVAQAGRVAAAGHSLFGSAPRSPAEPRKTALFSLRFGDRRLRLQDLAPPIHPAFEVDVMGAAQFARVLVLDIGRGLEGVGGAAHAA